LFTVSTPDSGWCRSNGGGGRIGCAARTIRRNSRCCPEFLRVNGDVSVQKPDVTKVNCDAQGVVEQVDDRPLQFNQGEVHMPSTLQTKVNARAAKVARTDGSTSHRKRHSIKLDEVAKADYLRLMPRFSTPGPALKAAGATPSMLARWREEDAAFLVAERQVREGIADQLEAEAVRRAFRGVRRPVYQGGLLAGYLTEYSDQLLMFVLKAMRPERFRDKSEISVTPIVKVVAGLDPGDVL
jgi:hypothetical protein